MQPLFFVYRKNIIKIIEIIVDNTILMWYTMSVARKGGEKVNKAIKTFMCGLLIFGATFIGYSGYNEYNDMANEINQLRKEVVDLDSFKLKQADTFNAELTAYTSGYESTGKTPNDIGYGITSSGKKVSQGTLAADTRFFPYGTKLYIEGLGVFEVQDTGGDIKGNRLDIWFENLDEAIKFGRQHRKVIVLFLPK